MYKNVILLLIGCILLCGCSNSISEIDNQSSRYTVNGGVLQTGVEESSEVTLVYELSGYSSRYFDLLEQKYYVDLTDLQFINLYKIDSDCYQLDIYERSSESASCCCSYTFSRESHDKYYMHTDEWFIYQNIYTKEVPLIEAR